MLGCGDIQYLILTIGLKVMRLEVSVVRLNILREENYLR